MGPEDARGQHSWIQVSYCLVGPMFRWEGVGAESPRSRGSEGARLWGSEALEQPGPKLGARGGWEDRRWGCWGLNSKVHECLVPLGAYGGWPLGWKDCAFCPGRVRVRVQGPVPPLPPSPRTRPGLTSAAPGLPPARLPTASCARRRSSNSGSNSGSGGGPRRRPRPRAAGLVGPMSRPSRPHVPCTPARPGPSGDRSSQRHRRRRLLLPPPAGCAGAASPAPRRPRLPSQDKSVAALRKVEQLWNPGWEPAPGPRLLEIPGVPPHARA